MAMNIADSPYKGSGSLTRAQFLFYETRTTAKLIVKGLNDQEIRAKVVEDNLFQYPTEKSITRMVHVCLHRLHGLKKLLNLIENAMSKKVADRNAENTIEQFGESLA